MELEPDDVELDFNKFSVFLRIDRDDELKLGSMKRVDSMKEFCFFYRKLV